MNRIKEKISRPYPIVLTKGFDALQKEIEAVYKPSSLLIITDSQVAPLYLEQVKQILIQIAPVYSYTFEAGEHSKHLNTVTAVYDALVEMQLDRNTLIVALGGGVVGDLAGFVASTYMRGIPFVQIPTTVLSQNDSSIGGKVGVDYFNHKNMVGAFYQPKLVYINIQVLQTLPEREYASGMAEIIKHGLIKNKALYNNLKQLKEAIKDKRTDALIAITYASCEVKCQVVEEDVYENGNRKILNFGHTIGHAIETLSDFKLLHGECVAYGMCMSAFISYQRGLLSKQDLLDIVNLCKDYQLLMPLDRYDTEKIIEQMGYDKKKAYGKIAFILLEGIGKASIVTDVTHQEIVEAVEFAVKTC